MADSTSLLEELSILWLQEKLKTGLDGGQEINSFCKRMNEWEEKGRRRLFFSSKFQGIRNNSFTHPIPLRKVKGRKIGRHLSLGDG